MVSSSHDNPPVLHHIIYGGTPHQFYGVAERLPADTFKVVTLDEFFEAARQARPLVEGHAWKPGADGYK